MVRHQIEIDEDTDRLLTDLASEYDGNLSLALTDLVHARQAVEEFAQWTETAHEDALRTMRDSAEADFREGRAISWTDIKARNGL